MKTLYLLGTQSCQIFNGLKRCDSKNAVLRCIKKVASLGTFIAHGKWWENRTDSAVTESK